MIATASMVLARGHVRGRALTGRPMTMALFAVATISDLAVSGLTIVLIGLKWF